MLTCFAAYPGAPISTSALNWLRTPKARVPHIMETDARLAAEFLIIRDAAADGRPVGPNTAGRVAFCGYGGQVRGWIWNIATLTERGWVAEAATPTRGRHYVATDLGRQVFSRLPEHAQQAAERYQTSWHMWS